MKTIIVVFMFAVALLLSVIFSSQWFCQGYEHQFYSGFIGSVLATIFAAFLVVVAWEELAKLVKTSSADFIHKLDNDFFTPETRTLVNLINCEALKFCRNDTNDEGEPYFKVDHRQLSRTNLPEELKEALGRRSHFSAWEVDDSLLGLLENVGMLERRGIVDFQMVYDVFGWYLNVVWMNDEIKKYIRYEREEEETLPIDTITYYHFQNIAAKCLEYSGIQRGPCRWWWRLKRRFRNPKVERFPSITT